MNQTIRTESTARRFDETAQVIFRLRLLIARAANRDSLGWWDDDALTVPAGFVFDRLFPVSPPGAARSLALYAATRRHQIACPASAVHLFRLDADNEDGLELRFRRLPIDSELDAPIPTLDALRERLLRLTGQPCPYTIVRELLANGLLIKIPPTPKGMHPLEHRARTLAWAYLEEALPFAMMN